MAFTQSAEGCHGLQPVERHGIIPATFSGSIMVIYMTGILSERFLRPMMIIVSILAVAFMLSAPAYGSVGEQMAANEDTLPDGVSVATSTPVSPPSLMGPGSPEAPPVPDIRPVGSVGGVHDLNAVTADQTIIGVDSYDYLGYTSTTADVNGDGYDDMILGAYYAYGPSNSNWGTGEVHIIYSCTKETIDLKNGDGDVVIYGEAYYNYFGFSLASGDVDNDGYDDIIVGAYTAGASRSGGAYVIFGGPSLSSVIDLSKSPVGVAKIYGTGSYTYTGSSMACGDVNNDGYDDIIIGAYRDSSYKGAVYIIHGGTGVKGHTYNLGSGDYDTKIEGRASSDYLGYRALTSGDFNGDGYDDVAAGAYYNDGDGSTISRSSCGAVYVFFGSASGISSMSLSTGSADISIYGANTNDRIGTALGCGDMDMDGKDELLLGSMYSSSYQGNMMMFWGSSLSGLTTPYIWDLSTLDPDFSMDGKSSYDYMGSAMTIGDMNGDGYGDLISGAYGASPQGRNYAGEVYVLFGNTSAAFPSTWDLALKAPDFLVQGAANYDYTGISLCTGNLDGDSQADLLIGAYGTSPGGRNYCGSGYVFLGQPPYMTINDFGLLNGSQPDNKTLYAAYKNYDFLVNVTDSWTLNDIKEIYLTVPVGMVGVDLDYKIILKWSRNHGTGVDTFQETNDPANLVTIMPGNCTVSNDGESTWVVTFSVVFNMAFPYEDYKEVRVLANGFGKLTDSASYVGVFRVENDLQLIGDLEVTAAIQGPIESGAWVQTNEMLTWTNLTVVYQGTTDLYPSDDLFDITLRDEEGNTYTDHTSSGVKFNIVTYSSPYTDVSDFEIFISNISYSGDDMTVTPYSFVVLVDGDSPTPPLGIYMRADGIDDENMYFDNDTEAFVTWDESLDAGSGVLGYYYSLVNKGGSTDGTYTTGFNGTLEFSAKGKAEVFIWAIDRVGNIGLAGNGSFIIDLDGVSFGDFTPGYNSWNRLSAVKCKIHVADSGGSGVLGSSIQYAVSIDDADTFSEWKGAHVRGDAQEMDVDLVANFPDGVGNVIKFRGQDIAHNPFEESDAHYLKVDTMPPVENGHTPLPEDVSSSTQVVCSISMEDVTSGLKLSSMQYAISTSGPDDFLGWTTAGLVDDEYGTIYHTINFTTSPLIFLEGKNNYIKYRIKDIAGNPYATFGPYQIVVKLPQANRAPSAVIAAPMQDQVFTTRDAVEFSSLGSIDPDPEDTLSFYWLANGFFGLSSSAHFNRTFAKGNYSLTLYVDDGVGHNVSTSVIFNVVPNPADLDTDGDGMMDDVNGNGMNDPGDDTDDDNDGLSDEREFEMGTNPKLNDTDGDGYNDNVDKYPLDYTRWEDTPVDNTSQIIFGVVLGLIVLIIVVIAMIMGVILAVKYKKARDEERAADELAEEARVEAKKRKQVESARRQQDAWATSKSGDVSTPDVTKIAQRQTDGTYSIPGVPGTYTMDQLKVAGLDYSKLMGYQSGGGSQMLPGQPRSPASLPPGSETAYQPHLPGEPPQ